MVTGEIVAPFCGPTRTEEDFLAHVQAVIATDPQASRWHVVCDNLNIHQSEALVRFVAELSGFEEDLGFKGKSGILASIQHYNRTMAKPFKWTYQGKALMA